MSEEEAPFQSAMPRAASVMFEQRVRQRERTAGALVVCRA